MPTFIHGKSSKVMISGYDASASIMSATASGQVETADVTCFGQSDKAYIVGLADATISAEGVYSGGTAEADEYLTALLGGTAIVWSLYEGGDTFGIQNSFLVLFMIIIGGLGTILGSFLGAAFLVLMPIALKTVMVDAFGLSAVFAKHLEYVLMGLLIIFFLILEPHGLARLWQIAKEKLRLWPFPY